MPNFHKVLLQGIEKLGKEEKFALEERDVQKLCIKAEEILITEPSLLRLQVPINIVGDIHGQVHELRNILTQGGSPPDSQYLFMGDYVDRGYYSCETIQLLLCLKVQYPDKVYLLRGNHECRVITKAYGFYEEIIRKYGNSNTYQYYMRVFDSLPLAAVISNTYFCVHAGISQDIKMIDQINLIDRKCEIPEKGSFADLLWSDPEDFEYGWATNSRGAGHLYGEKVTKAVK